MLHSLEYVDALYITSLKVNNYFLVFMCHMFYSNTSLNPDDVNQVRAVKDLPASISTLLDCPDPPKKPPSPTHPSFALLTEEEIPNTLSFEDYAWLLARTLSREKVPNDVQVQQEEECCQNKFRSGQLTVQLWVKLCQLQE